MVVPKVEIFSNSDPKDLQTDINEFLSVMDVRQVIRMEYSSAWGSSSDLHSCLIMYIGLDDVRDIKIDTVLDK